MRERDNWNWLKVHIATKIRTHIQTYTYRYTYNGSIPWTRRNLVCWFFLFSNILCNACHSESPSPNFDSEYANNLNRNRSTFSIVLFEMYKQISLIISNELVKTFRKILLFRVDFSDVHPCRQLNRCMVYKVNVSILLETILSCSLAHSLLSRAECDVSSVEWCSMYGVCMVSLGAKRVYSWYKCIVTAVTQGSLVRTSTPNTGHLHTRTYNAGFVLYV